MPTGGTCSSAYPVNCSPAAWVAMELQHLGPLLGRVRWPADCKSATPTWHGPPQPAMLTLCCTQVPPTLMLQRQMHVLVWLHLVTAAVLHNHHFATLQITAGSHDASQQSIRMAVLAPMCEILPRHAACPDHGLSADWLAHSICSCLQARCVIMHTARPQPPHPCQHQQTWQAPCKAAR